MRFGAADRAEAHVLARRGGQDGVERAHFGHLFEQLARGRAQAARFHPLLKGAPQDQREKADEDVRLCAPLFSVEDRAESQVVFGDAEGVFDLREADVGAPEFFGASSGEVGAQKVGAVGPRGPFVKFGLASNGNGKPFLAFVPR